MTDPKDKKKKEIDLQKLFNRARKNWLWVIFGILVFVFTLTELIARYVYSSQLFHADYFALAQLIGEMILLPLVILGGLVAIEELRRLNEKPDLTIYFKVSEGINKIGRSDEYEVRNKDLIGASVRVPSNIFLNNDGDAIAVKWRIVLKIPIRMTDNDHYQKQDEIIDGVTYYVYAYGNNEFGDVFPGDEKSLIIMSFDKGLLDEKVGAGRRLNIDYTIYVHGGARVDGVLTILNEVDKNLTVMKM